jgi:formate hydrogenlyase subunit 4
MRTWTWLHPLLALALSPLLGGVIARTKSLFAGRTGPPLLQPYHDLARLLRKGAVYSGTTTIVFRAAPVVALAAVVVATLVIPFGGAPALLAFPGDFVLVVGLLAAGRFATVLAALDTGSSFEGMGASREMQFAALAEPALFLSLAAVGLAARGSSLSGMQAAAALTSWLAAGPALPLVAAALIAVLLAENARIPVDDPATHLELTMIHEVMVLDHGGPDLAFILYASALKLWVMGALFVDIALPFRTGGAWFDGAVSLAGMAVLGVLIGTIESSMARLRLTRVPQLLVGAATLAALALVLVLR